MEECCAYAVSFVVGLLLFLVIFFWSDADLLLIFAECFGKSGKHLRGKVVWITGSSSGIGEYLAYDLARVGCKLILSARRSEELERVKQACLECSSLQNEDILVLAFDMVDLQCHRNVLQKVLNHFNKVDILVNNAGRSQRASWGDIEVAVDRELFEVDVFSVVHLTRVVLPDMLDKKSGQVVVTGSLAGKMGVPFSATYCGAKYALHVSEEERKTLCFKDDQLQANHTYCFQGYFEGLRIEHPCLDVTMVCPGPVASNLLPCCFTAESGKEYKQERPPKQKGMATSRCSHLMTIAIANKLSEVWIATQPVLLFAYLAQYFPSFSKWFGKRVGLKIATRMRDGDSKPQNQSK